MTKNIVSEKKGVLQCRSCNKVFNHKDLKVKQVERYGILLKENICPYCGSNTYGLIDYPVSEEELIYKSGKFYLHSGKDLKYRIDRAVELEV